MIISMTLTLTTLLETDLIKCKVVAAVISSLQMQSTTFSLVYVALPFGGLSENQENSVVSFS